MLRFPSSASSPTSHSHLPAHPRLCSTRSCTGRSAVSAEMALLVLRLQPTPATARRMHGYQGAQPEPGMLQRGRCDTRNLHAPRLGRTDVNRERDSKECRVRNNLEDRAYVREGCKWRGRTGAPTTPMGKKHPHHTHPDPPHGRHDLHSAVGPWHIQAPDVLQGKKERIS